MKHTFSHNIDQSGISVRTSAGFLRKFAIMTVVVFAVYGVLSLIGFYLWFAFPVDNINNVTYLKNNDLILYYSLINFNDIIGVIFFSHFVYYKYVESDTPVRDGVYLGIYLIIFSWALDLFIYVFIRKTLPTMNEYFLGKNQPEIGIAWITAFISALSSGWLHSKDQNKRTRFSYKRTAIIALITTFLSAISTVIGVRFFDVRP